MAKGRRLGAPGSQMCLPEAPRSPLKSPGVSSPFCQFPLGLLWAPCAPPGRSYALKTNIFATFLNDFQGGLGRSLGGPWGVPRGPWEALGGLKGGEGELAKLRGDFEKLQETSRRLQGGTFGTPGPLGGGP